MLYSKVNDKAGHFLQSGCQIEDMLLSAQHKMGQKKNSINRLRRVRREDAKMERQVNPPIRQIPVRSGFAGSRKAPQSVVTLRNRATTIATISAHLGFRIR
jgi:hypothetical protein